MLKVIGTDNDRSATCDFILLILSYHETISVSEINGDFNGNRSIFHPRVFYATSEGVPLELGSGDGVKKTRMMGLPGRERRLTIFSAVWIKYTNVTEGRTDGQTDRQTDREGRTPDDSKVSK